MFRAHVLIVRKPKIVLYNLWYHPNETIEWSKITKITKITKIQFCKYEHIVVKLMCEFFGCDYCVLLTVAYCIVQFLPPDDEHVCSKHVEA